MALLNNDFKVKNGLTVNTTVSAGGSVEGACYIRHDGTSSQFLKGDGTVDTTTYTACVGDITGVTTNAGISGGGTAGDITIGIDATTAAGFDQSGCAGILCTGDITNVSTGTYLTGGGASGSVEVGIDSACSSAWDAAVAGGISEVTTSSLLSGGGPSGSVEVGIDSGAVAYLDQSACAGILCVGDVTGVTAGDALSGGGFAGDLTIGIDASSAANWDQSGCAGIDCVGVYISIGVSDGIESSGGSSPTLGIATACNTKWDQSGCAGLACTGTVTPTSSDTFTNKSGDISQWTNNSLYMTPSSTDNFTNKSGAISQWTNDLVYTTCTGDINDVSTSTDYMTGGGASGPVEVGIDSACTAKWDDAAGGSITAVTTTSLLTGGGSSGSVEVGIGSGALTYLDQSGCSGLTCTGDIAGVTLTAGLTGSSLTSGTACIGIDASSAANWDQSGCAGILCIGTVTASTTNTFTNKSGSNSQWTNDENYTTCIGDITNVTTSTDYMTGGAASGSAEVGLDSACTSKWDSGVGTVTEVTQGDGILVSSGTTTPDICVDSTVVRTSALQCIAGKKVFQNDIITVGLSSTGTVTANCLATGAVMEVNVGVDTLLPEGTVLVINTGGCIIESTMPNSTMVFGVAAGDMIAPIVMGAEPVCMTGEVCIGDYITTSDKPGHGHRSSPPHIYGAIIGQALEDGTGESHAIKAMIRKM